MKINIKISILHVMKLSQESKLYTAVVLKLYNSNKNYYNFPTVFLKIYTNIQISKNYKTPIFFKSAQKPVFALWRGVAQNFGDRSATNIFF